MVDHTHDAWCSTVLGVNPASYQTANASAPGGPPPASQPQPDGPPPPPTDCPPPQPLSSQPTDPQMSVAPPANQPAPQPAGPRTQDESREAYEAAWNPLRQRLDRANGATHPASAAMRQTILTHSQRIAGMAQSHLYTDALHEIPALTHELDDLEHVETEHFYVVTYEGQQYRGTQQQLEAVRQAVTQAAINRHIGPLRSLAQAHTEAARALEQLNNEQYIVAFLVAHAAGADFATVTSAVARQDQAINALEQTIRTPGPGSESAYRSAVEAVNAAAQALSTYQGRIDTGASRAVTVLTVTEVACFTIAAALGGAVLAEGIAGVGGFVGSNAIIDGAATAGNATAGAGFSVLQSLAERGGADLAGIGSHQTVGQAAYQIGRDAALNVVGTLIGGRYGQELKNEVQILLARELQMADGQIVAHITNEEYLARIAGFVSERIGDVLTNVIQNWPAVAAGNKTMTDIVRDVVTAMLAGPVGVQLRAAVRGS